MKRKSIKKDWAKEAVPENRKGVFREKAEKAGKSTSEFAKEHRDSPGKLGKEARLAETFSKMRKHGKKKTRRTHSRSM